MAEHEIKAKEDTEEARHRKKAQPLYDQLKATDEGILDFQVEPSVDSHAALLADVHSDEQRANLVTQLQQSYGNAYVQLLLSSKVIQSKFTASPPDNRLEQKAEEGSIILPFAPIFGADAFTYTFEGEKALTGANARWEGTADIDPWPLPKVEKKEKQWFGVLNKCDCNAKYWLNSTTKWNDIKDFPGGPYDPSFNTKEGSKTHERAELDAVKELFLKMANNIREGIKKGFPTQKDAENNYKKVWDSKYKNYKSKQQAISDHKNPVGPDAEWEYYKAEYEKYKASLKKSASEKK